jgi:LL-diaminopimelate aminotransferase
VWLPIPRRYSSSSDFTRDLVEKAGVLVSPGAGFGAAGEGYIRIALCDTTERMKLAAERMVKAGMSY